MRRLWYRLVWLWSWRSRRKYPRHNSKRCEKCAGGNYCVRFYRNVPLVLYNGDELRAEETGSLWFSGDNNWNEEE